MVTSQAKIAENILAYCLKNCVFDGWTEKLLRDACKSLDIQENYWKIIFPDGVTDVVDLYVDNANTSMAKGLKLKEMRTPEKIKALIKNRLTQHENEKAAIRSCMAVYTLHPSKGLQASYRTLDAIWRLAGDTATDWNFYSKRILLGGVYMATLNYWLEDNSEGHADTWKFLDSRLADVAKFGKFTGSVKEQFSDLAKRFA